MTATTLSPLDAATTYQLARELRGRGCAVAVFTAGELDGVEPDAVEDAMRVAGADAIGELRLVQP